MSTSAIKPIDKASFLEVDKYDGISKEVAPAELVKSVNALFEEAGHPNPQAWSTYMQPGSWNHTDDKIQRFAINTALRLILGNVTTVSTIDVRFCIVDEASIQDWLRLIKSEIVPFFIKNQILF